MRTPQSLIGRITVLAGVLAVFIAVAVGAVLVLRPDSAVSTAEPGEQEAFSPLPVGGPIIARVDGSPIYLEEAELRIGGLASLHGDVEDVMGADWPDKVLQSLIDDHLLQSEAEDAGIVVTQAEVADSLESVKSLSGSADDFDAWLQDQGMTLPELERRIWMQALTGDVYTAVTSEAQVSREEIRTYYRENKDLYEGVDGVVLPFLAVRASIRQELTEQRQSELFSTWLEDQRTGAQIEIVDENWWKEIR